MLVCLVAASHSEGIFVCPNNISQMYVKLDCVQIHDGSVHETTDAFYKSLRYFEMLQNCCHPRSSIHI